MLAMMMISQVVVVNLGVGMGSYGRVCSGWRWLAVVFCAENKERLGGLGAAELGFSQIMDADAEIVGLIKELVCILFSDEMKIHG